MCLICNLEKYNFEKAGIDFDIHRKKEHNIWDYIYMIISMEDKTEKDCNGIESELYAKIKNGDFSWIPVKRSMSLGIFLKIIYN